MFSFGDIQVKVDYNWPKDKFAGYVTRTFKGHWIIQWLSKYIPFDPDVHMQVKSYTWRDPIMVDNSVISLFPAHSGRTLIMGPEQYSQLKMELEKTK